jgi:ribose transport system ATP-binding protein
LPKAGKEQLFSVIREIAMSGACVLFVSHHLDEVRDLTDRVTVLRDGRVVGTVETASVTESDLVEMILGRKLAALSPAGSSALDRPAIAVIEDLQGNLADSVAFSVHQGEVLGLTGLAGSGFEEIPYLIFGAQRAKRGVIALNGRTHPLSKMTPPRGLTMGMALVPADRQRDASLPNLSITDNVVVPALISRFFKKFVLRRKQMETAVGELMRQFDVRPPDPRPLYSSLSGGNQQKTVLAKWFATSPELLLLHEPTQGVDVGARGQIFQLLRGAAERGMAVICASNDYEQLEAICDRVLVFSRGKISAELVGRDVERERIADESYKSAVAG